MHIIEKSWGKVTKQTIDNCFKHVGFVQDKTFVFEEDSTANIFEDTHTKISEYYPVANLVDYLDADNNLRTADSVTEESIISNIRRDDLSDDSDEEIILDDEDEIVPPRHESAATALRTLRVFLEGQDDSSMLLLCLSEIEDYSITELTFRKATKQMLITSYSTNISENFSYLFLSISYDYLISNFFHAINSMYLVLFILQ